MSHHWTHSLLTLNYPSPPPGEAQLSLAGPRHRETQLSLIQINSQKLPQQENNSTSCPPWGFILCNKDHQGERYGNSDRQNNYFIFIAIKSARDSTNDNSQEVVNRKTQDPASCSQLQDHHLCNLTQPMSHNPPKLLYRPFSKMKPAEPNTILTKLLCTFFTSDFT